MTEAQGQGQEAEAPRKKEERSFLGPTIESLLHGEAVLLPAAQNVAPYPAATAPGPGGPTIATGVELAVG